MNNNLKPAIRFKGFTEAWEQRKFGEMADYKKGPFGSALKKEIFVPKGENSVKVYEQQNAINKNWKLERYFITKEYANELKAFETHGGDILVSCAGTIGEMYELPNTSEVGVINQALMRVRVNEKVISKKLYKLLFSNMIDDFSKEHSNGSAMKNIPPFADLKAMVAMVPVLDEQEKIGAYFNKFDNLITLHQRKYDQLVNVKKAMLEKMFPRDGKNVPEIRFAGFTDAWEQRKLSEIATMHARIGWQNLRTSEFLDSGNYMLITGTDFENGTINFDTCHYVERERYEQDKHIQIKNGSILITKDGTLGKVAYVQGLSMPATLNAGVFNVEIKDKTNVDNKYLFQYLKAPYLMDYVDKKATGGTIKHLNQNILVDFPVVMPSRQEQRLIGAYFSNLDILITLHQREVEKLKNIKKSCLEKMFV